MEKKFNLLIPMAGLGLRFKEKGHCKPKPLIDVFGKVMVSWVINNFDPELIENYVFVCNAEHEREYSIGSVLKDITNNRATIFYVESLTEGAACTTLLAKSAIDNDNPLIVANSDQFVEWNFGEFHKLCTSDLDGVILTFKSDHPKWSYVRTNASGHINQVAEKKVISSSATVGIYFWKKGSDYVKYAEQMISKNIRTNNEFYVCPVYNEAIEDGKIIKTFEIPIDNMWGLGTPEDLDSFLLRYNPSKVSRQ